MKKSFVLSLVLSLSMLCFAGEKSFFVAFDKATTVGSLKLAPGEYKVKLDGTNVVFTNSSYKSVGTAAKVETAAKKFKDTAVETMKSGSGEAVSSIEIGGTTTRLDFVKSSTATN